jgi:hypothetical protein
MFHNLVSMFRRWKARAVPLVHARGVSILSADRRQFVRFPSAGQTSVRPACPKNQRDMSARICNVSWGGIRLVADGPLKQGALLHVTLRTDKQPDAEAILACVVHAAHVYDAQWSVGCSFIRDLTYEELQALL